MMKKEKKPQIQKTSASDKQADKQERKQKSRALSAKWKRGFAKIAAGAACFFYVLFMAFIAGNIIVPEMAYWLANQINLTQETPIYTAIASWILPCFSIALVVCGMMIVLCYYGCKALIRRSIDMAEKHIEKQNEKG